MKTILYTIVDIIHSPQTERRMFMAKKFEELQISDDFMFGVIMRNPKYCKPFLETILNIKINHNE